ncbi:MAG: hypothetical protein ACLFR0_05920 [Alphaproteobacteria bacterium]
MAVPFALAQTTPGERMLQDERMPGTPQLEKRIFKDPPKVITRPKSGEASEAESVSEEADNEPSDQERASTGQDTQMDTERGQADLRVTPDQEQILPQDPDVAERAEEIKRYMRQNNITSIEDIDVRELERRLATKGFKKPGSKASGKDSADDMDVEGTAVTQDEVIEMRLKELQSRDDEMGR